MELPLTDRLVDRQRDALFDYPAETQAQYTGSRPWMTDPLYFKTVRISPIALVKMVMHARSGGSLEVMGIMQGYVDGTALVVTDAFRLPVEGTETRVNAQGEADEYLVEYLGLCRDESRQENVIGWYHSHPGYGCWLSGIDVATQQLQQFQGPMVAVVIDPDRTVSGGKVDIGAFRTYPEGYVPEPNIYTTSTFASAVGDRHVPLTKATDFGAHSAKYYALEVEHFRSGLDAKLLALLWDRYWVPTLAANPLLTNREFASSQMGDVAQRMQQLSAGLSRGSRGQHVAMEYRLGGPGSIGGGHGGGPSSSDSGSGSGSGSAGTGGSGAGGGRGVVGAKNLSDSAIDKIVQTVGQIAARERAGLVAAEVKAQIFSDGST